ncbi:MAG: alpha/beta hydrolase [Pseudomonadales bacterium]
MPDTETVESIDVDRIVGIWEGTLSQTNLRIVVRITDEDGRLTARFDSPDQNAYGIAADTVSFDGERLVFNVDSINAGYAGTLYSDRSLIQGRWSQTVDLELDLVRVDKPSVRARAQNPKPPFPYRIEDVSFPGGERGVTLAGTLTLPESEDFPVVVLVTGSGAQDRDETIKGHKPFWVLADYLSRNGVGVLRYDDRGFAQSTGDISTAITPDFADDALAAISYLQSRTDIVASRIGVVGHSEGGSVVSILAGRDDPLACGVMMAGPAVSGEKIHQRQVRLIIERQPFPIATGLIEKIEAMNEVLYTVARADASFDERRAAARDVYRSALSSFDDVERKLLNLNDEVQVDAIVTDWFRYFLDYDPRNDLAASRIPLFAIYGALDLQVPPDQSIPVLEKINANHGKIDIRTFPELNHLFQHATTGLPSEYGMIAETLAPEVMLAIKQWVLVNC